MSRITTLLCVLLAQSVLGDNSTDVCGIDSEQGPWGELLEDWVTTPERPGRQGRILSLPNKSYYISDRIDLVPPPPAPHLSSPTTRINTGAHGPPLNMNPSAPSYNYYEPTYTNSPGNYQNNPAASYNQNPQNSPSGSYVSQPMPLGPAESYDQASQNNQIGQYAQPPQNIAPSGSYSQTPQNIPPYGQPPQNPGYVQPPQNSEYTQTQNSGYGQAPQNSPPSGPYSQAPQSPNPPEPHPSAPTPTATPSGPKPYNEWQGPPPPARPGKIVNRPPNPNKDKFKPSYEYYEKPQQPYKPAPTQPTRPNNQVDRVDDPPKRQVSETDLYLLSAIEKLVYRVDLMEKRLRKVEESMHYIVIGHDPKPEPCVANFTRVSGICYHFSQEAVDWKTASITCRKMKSHLLELETEGERRQLMSWLLADKRNRGVNWWTGGLNPGLLWIWAHSAGAIVRNSTTSKDNDPPVVTITGEGRCLALLHDAPVNGFVYRGEECGYRHRYICEKEEDKTKLSNEIQRVSRQLHITADKIVDSRRRAKIMWDNDS